MRAPIETKVAGPAIITGLLGAGGGALYAVLLAYDYIAPNAEQSAALAGLGAFTLYAVQTVSAYLLPHTARTDPDALAAAERQRVRLHRRGATAEGAPASSSSKRYAGDSKSEATWHDGSDHPPEPGSERLP